MSGRGGNASHGFSWGVFLQLPLQQWLDPGAADAEWPQLLVCDQRDREAFPPLVDGVFHVVVIVLQV